MRSGIWLGLALAVAGGASANEVTLQNDSLTNNSSGTIQAGFVAGEKAASWLTSPCDGNIVAAQVFWRSLTGGAPVAIEDSIDIYRSGTFPTPGDLAQEIGGPVLTDGVINEYRYLDENNTIPLVVPVAANETLVFALTFAEAPDPSLGPSVVDDDDGIEPNRNAIYANISGSTYAWMSNSSLGVNGDWVIRAVVDCQSGSTNADVSAAMTSMPAAYTPGGEFDYTITIANAGPANALGTTVVDSFPAAYTGAQWTCTATGGATCPASGSGTIAHVVALPAAGQVVYAVTGVVAAGTTGVLSNSVTAVVGAPATDPDTGNNSASVDATAATTDVIFTDGFDPAARAPLRIVGAGVGRR